jgi:hypothetical protein
MEILILLCLTCIVPWQFAAWLRIPRYARIFRQEKYDFFGYLRWLLHTSAEFHYHWAFVIAFITYPFFICGGILFLGRQLPQIAEQYPLVVGVINLGLILLAFYFAPRNGISDQNLNLTPQAVRLIITSFLLELIPAWVGLGVAQSAFAEVADPKNSPESMGVLALPFLAFINVVIIMIGPIAFALTPYSLLIASVVNGPIDLVSHILSARKKPADSDLG